MVSMKRLVQMARKWHKMSALGRRRIIMSSMQTDGSEESATCSSTTTTSVATKGHVFVYAIDGRRFMIPLQYLNSNIFHELFKLSEEEFGLPSNGPIVLPCDGTSMEYILSLLRRRISKDMERVVLASVCRCTTRLPLCEQNQLQQIISSF